jgi:hypothetical protein
MAFAFEELKLKFITAEYYKKIYFETVEINKMLSGLINSIKPSC